MDGPFLKKQVYSPVLEAWTLGMSMAISRQVRRSLSSKARPAFWDIRSSSYPQCV